MHADPALQAATLDSLRAQATQFLARLDVLNRALIADLARLAISSTPSITCDQFLDQQQVLAYELAFSQAELAAAEAALTSGAINPLDQALALLAVAQATDNALQVLLTHSPETQLSAAMALCSDPTWLAFKRRVQQGDFAQSAGELLLTAASEYASYSLSPDVAMAQQAFERFAKDTIEPLAEKIHREDLTVPESLLQGLRDMGVFGLSIPQQFGGSAPDEGEQTELMLAVTETLSKASLAAAGSLITRPEILSRALLAGGTQAQKEKWLPRLASGEALCAISITEPDYGSDVAGLTLRASPTEGGWLLNGSKTWCTFAGKAKVIMVVARTEVDRSLGHRGLSLLLVEKPSFEEHAFEVASLHKLADGKFIAGALSGKAIPTIGYRGMHSFVLAFENFFVSAENLIGEQNGRGKGFYLTMAGMQGGRIQTSARACGVMRAAIDTALDYAGQRKVFGKALGQYQLTSAKLARMAAKYHASRQLMYRVGKLMDAGGGRMQASLAKLYACRCAEIVTREALQIFGGMGYAEEASVSRFFVDARVLSIFEGAEETLALKVVARALFEPFFSPAAVKSKA